MPRLYWLSGTPRSAPLRNHRGTVVCRTVDAFGVEDSEIVHGLAVALFGGGAIVIAGCGEVFLHAGAFFVKGPEAEHRRRKPAFGSAVQPARSLFAVLRNA